MRLLLFLVPSLLFAQTFSQTPHTVQNKVGATAELCLQYTDATKKCFDAGASGWVPKTHNTIDFGVTGTRLRDGWFQRDVTAAGSVATPNLYVTDIRGTVGGSGIISIFNTLWPDSPGKNIGDSNSSRRFAESHVVDGYFYDDVVITDALQVGGATSLGGHVTFATDNTYSFGTASGGRPANFYATATIAAMYSGTSTTGASLHSSGIVTANSSGTLTGLWTTSSGALYAAGGFSVSAATIVNSSAQWTTNFLFSADNTYTIGTTSNNRPSNVYSTGNIAAMYSGTSTTGAALNSTGVFVANSGGTSTGIWSSSSGALWAAGGFSAGSFPGSAGQNVTTTVAASGGGSCTLVFTGGLKTGGTC